MAAMSPCPVYKHPGTRYKVGATAGGRRLDGLFCRTGIIRNNGQPGKGHSYGQFDGFPHSHRAIRLERCTTTENDSAQDQREDQQGRYDDDIDASQIFQSQHDPQRDESCYDDAPEGRTDSRNRIGRYGSTGNHDGSPADELDDVQPGKQFRSLASKGNLHRFHGAPAGPAANHAGTEHDGTADDVADNNGQKPFAEPQRCQKHPRQNFGNRNTGAKP